MKDITGFLIRRARLEQNLSQESLCKGICAVSYLSKIEKGQARAGEEIITLLFEALGIDFVQDEAFIKRYTDIFYAYFDWCYNEGMDSAELAMSLEKAEARLLASPLYLNYQLFRVTKMAQEDPDSARALIEALVPFEGYMDQDTELVYRLCQGTLLPQTSRRSQALERAKTVYPCSLSFFVHAQHLFEVGEIQGALKVVEIGSGMAVTEGTLAMIRQFALLEGHCYANLLQYDLMMRAYKRVLALNRGDDQVKGHIYFNIGTTLMEMQRDEEALPYLLQAHAMNPDSFMTCHRLALIYERLGRRAQGQPFLEKLLPLAQAEGTALIPLARLAQMRYRDGYLESDRYLALLEDVYTRIADNGWHGLKQSHSVLLTEAYVHRRRYKDALRVAQEATVTPL